MICTQCHKENREIARYCKWCGAAIVRHTDPLDKLVGMDEVKRQLKQIASVMSHLRAGGHSGQIGLNINTIIIGETGTGKTTIPQIMSEYLANEKILKKPKLKVVDAVDYGRFVEKWEDNIKDAKGGILFLDNVQKLLPDSYAKNVNPLDKLFIEMDKWNNDPIVVLAGLPGGFEEFLENNPAARNRFKYLFRLEPLNAEELYELILRTLQQRYAINSLSTAAAQKLMRQIKHEVKTKDESFGYAHHALGKAEDLFTSYISHPTIRPGEIQEEDIQGYVPPIKTIDDILAELDEFIGMNEVKKAIKEIAWEVRAGIQRQQRGLDTEVNSRPPIHIVLTGNPGTGKTSIARKLGEIFEAIGYLDSGHVEEVDRSRMVSQYVGETPKVVDRLCDKAMGGILFIDEAYTLAPINESGTKDEQGTQALEKLMKRMEDDRGRFVVIAAGYKNEMENLLRVNPGMRSRFNRYLHINDYTPEELYQILLVFARKKNYTLTDEADDIAKKAIKQIYDNKNKSFANAREMRLLFEKMCTLQAERISRMPLEEQSNETLLTFEAEDIPYERKTTVNYEECLKGLNMLVGLKNVKEEITQTAAFINLQIQRGDTASIQGWHYIFTGNPGTGKTSVARIMADTLKALGVVSRGQLIEADRSKLVAGFAGQTSIKTNQLIDSALGGVLFIDEAYTLCQGENDIYGKEALDTLLKRLEDDRGKFICIVAGYTKEMHQFIDSNPGMKSRFNKTIHFEDYKPEELTQIFLNLARKNNFVVNPPTEQALLHHLEHSYATRNHNFGNAREVRSLFDMATTNQSKRLVSIMNDPSFQQEMMFELTTEDIIGSEKAKAKSLDEVLAELDGFIGMTSIKEAIRRLAVQAVFIKQRLQLGIGSSEPTPLNIVLTGNPGTGKTSVARKMGEILKAIGILPTDNVIEVDRNQMVGKYMGETPKLVNALCNRAMGGILFIDEAYTLYDADGGGGDKYGKEAVEALMKRMEDDKGKFVVIAAGYRKEMTTFMQVNPGLESRFTHRLHIEDYTEIELSEIFKALARKKQYLISEQAEAVLFEQIHELFVQKTRNFGNAREIRRLFDATIQQLSMRVSAIPSEKLTQRDYQLIEAQDIQRATRNIDA